MGGTVPPVPLYTSYAAREPDAQQEDEELPALLFVLEREQQLAVAVGARARDMDKLDVWKSKLQRKERVFRILEVIDRNYLLNEEPLSIGQFVPWLKKRVSYE